MKYILMNKNTEVLTADYDTGLKVFTNICDVINFKYAPLILMGFKNSDFNITLSDWFKGRGIPSWRDDIDLLLNKLDITTPSELLDKAFGLSLSDQYWVKPFNLKINYDDINFFEHSFDDSEFINITFGNDVSSSKINMISPNNTTDGRLKKTWIIDHNNRYLLKGGYRSEVMQPFNEVLASIICKRMGFYHVPYTIDIVHDKVVSKCPCFINQDTEFIPAYQILYNCTNNDNAYENYINILEMNGIKNARDSIEDMLILDYIMLNEDRHLNNFGIIRNVETLKWVSVAPIFDTGESLNIIDYSNEEVVINGDGRFFYSTSNFDSMIKHINNIKRYNLNKLDSVVEEFDKLLHQYVGITHITDRRINKICTLLNSRIERLKELIKL